MKQALRVINSLLVIGMGVAFLWHFKNIWCYGGMIIKEPNHVVLIFEIVFVGTFPHYITGCFSARPGGYIS